MAAVLFQVILLRNKTFKEDFRLFSWKVLSQGFDEFVFVLHLQSNLFPFFFFFATVLKYLLKGAF